MDWQKVEQVLAEMTGIKILLGQNVFNDFVRPFKVRAECEIIVAVAEGNEEFLKKLEIRQHERELRINWWLLKERGISILPFDYELCIFDADTRNAINYSASRVRYSVWFNLYNAILRAEPETKINFLQKRAFQRATLRAALHVIRNCLAHVQKLNQKPTDVKTAIECVTRTYEAQIRDIGHHLKLL